MQRKRPQWPWSTLAWLTAMAVMACAPSSLVDVQSPSTVVDPSTVQTVSGAIGLRAGAAAQLMYTLFGDQYDAGLVAASGMFTDELEDFANNYQDLDARTFQPANYWLGGLFYKNLQSARVKAGFAREALRTYAANTTTAPRAWQGEVYAWEGYAVLWLAEIYCSGIPLTVVPFKGTPTPTRGFTTTELFQYALAAFDSAMVLGADSASYVNLARVGKGRALVGLGQLAAADSAVAVVPTDFVYRLQADSGSGSIGQNWLPAQVSGAAIGYPSYSIVDREGGNGLVWSTDPRPGGVMTPSPYTTVAPILPAKYNVTGGTLNPSQSPTGVPFRLADGLEARLIQAEAALARGDGTWLTILNTLRTTCVGASPCAPVPGMTAASLSALTDPGTDGARIDLLFRERAMWLYLTAHRVGDLRRLANLYHRDPTTLWPTGQYFSPTSGPQGMYGTDVVLTPDPSEAAGNPLYSGCYNVDN